MKRNRALLTPAWLYEMIREMKMRLFVKMILRYFRWNRKSASKGWGHDGESNKSFPLTPSLFLRERENHSARLEGPNASERSAVQVLVEPPWRRPSMRGIEANIPRTFTKLSHVLPLPKGEGGVRGKGLVCRLRLSFQPLAPLLFHRK